LRALRPGIKILAISGGGPNLGLEILTLARKFGADQTLGKPFSPDDLVVAVRQLLRAA